MSPASPELRGLGGCSCPLPDLCAHLWDYDNSFAGGPTGSCGLLVGNGKLARHKLNNHLASCLDKVRALEKANGNLDVKIRHWYQKQVPRLPTTTATTSRPSRTSGKGFLVPPSRTLKIVLQSDSAFLAVDNFQTKLETEQNSP